MGGKGSAPSNNQMLQFEMQQAEEARQKEELRKARLEKGTTRINEIFGGKKILAPKIGKLDFSTTTDPSISGASTGKVGDTGFTWAKTGAEADPRWASATPDQRAWGMQNMGPSGYQLKDAAGNVLETGADWASLVAATKDKEYNMLAPTGAFDPSEPGFQQDWYDKFKASSYNLSHDQMLEQLSKMSKNLSYDLARAGMLHGSARGDVEADLQKQRVLNEAVLADRAEKETAGLRSSINSQQQQLINQLYATEDPTIAENAALGYVRNAGMQVPTQSNLGDMFRPLVIGALGAYSGYQDQSNFNQGAGQRTGRGQGNVTTTQS